MSDAPTKMLTSVHIRVTSRAELDEELERGVYQLRSAAQQDRQGILVTRHSPYDFVLELHRDVPFGLTLEKQMW